MRNLTTTLCVLLPFVLGSLVGCKSTSHTPLTVMVPKSVNNLPPCQTDKQIGICGGTKIIDFGWMTLLSTGGWKNGKAYGNMKGTTFIDSKIESSCNWTSNLNGKQEGWENCEDGNNRFKSRKFYVNGVESSQKGAEVQQVSYRMKCKEIGFTPKTDKFADCVLRLMEMQSNNRPQTVIQNNTGDSSAVRALLEEQKKQRQLEGALELMKRGSEMMSGPKPKLTCKYNTFTKTTVCH